jgi:hypothetical protein
MREKGIGGIYRSSLICTVDIRFHYWGNLKKNWELHTAE